LIFFQFQPIKIIRRIDEFQGSGGEHMSDLQISGNLPQTSMLSGRTAETASAFVPQKQKEERPSLFEQMQEAREKAEKLREQYKLPKNNRSYGDAPIEAYSRLARARNAAQVNSAAGFARRKIFQLKAAKKQDPDHARQIQGAINQLQKAVNRAGKKRNDLAREALTEKRRKKLIEEKQRQKAKRLHQQLQSRRTMRYLRETGYIREAEADARFNRQMDAESAKLREQFQAVSGAAASAQDAAISRYAAQAASLEAPPPDPTVTAEA